MNEFNWIAEDNRIEHRKQAIKNMNAHKERTANVKLTTVRIDRNTVKLVSNDRYLKVLMERNFNQSHEKKNM